MNQLQHLSQFEQALADYQLSAAARQTLDAVNLVMLLGATGSGRNTLIAELVRQHNYYFVISDTTRQPRSNNGVLEQSGREYWFRTEIDMLADIRAGLFLEAEIIHEQQVSGISIRELGKALDANKIAITDADIGGVQNALRLKPATTAVLVIPPGFEEWQRRLQGRGDMPNDELKRRLTTAVKVFTIGLEDERFQIVMNDEYQSAAEHIHQLVDGTATDERDRLQAVCQQLVADTKAYLQTL